MHSYFVVGYLFNIKYHCIEKKTWNIYGELQLELIGNFVIHTNRTEYSRHLPLEESNSQVHSSWTHFDWSHKFQWFRKKISLYYVVVVVAISQLFLKYPRKNEYFFISMTNICSHFYSSQIAPKNAIILCFMLHQLASAFIHCLEINLKLRPVRNKQ